MKWTLRDLIYILTIISLGLAWMVDYSQNYGSPTQGRVCKECGSDGNAHVLSCPVIDRLIAKEKHEQKTWFHAR